MIRCDVSSIIGEPVAENPERMCERDHFMACRACGQLIDLRDLAAVMHHEMAEHRPLPRGDFIRLLSVSHRLRSMLHDRAG